MSQYLIQESTLTTLGDAVRELGGAPSSTLYTPAEMAEHILLNAPPYDSDSVPIYVENKALEAVKVAQTYWTARAAGREFNYSTSTFLSGGTVNGSTSRGKIDCSTYIHLVLRGIPYESSPYVDTTASLAGSADMITTNPTGKYTWADDNLKNSSITGGIVRTASDIAKYYWAKGRVFFDSSKVCPGDLIFCADSANNRFKNITHVGIVTDDITNFYETTNATNVIMRVTLASRDIVFFARPDYENPNRSYLVDDSFNWVSAPWYFNTTTTQNGVTFTPDFSTGTFVSSGSATDKNTFTIISGYYPWYIPAGTYKLTGAPARLDRGSRVDCQYWGLRLWPLDGRTITSNVTGFTSNDFTPSNITTVEQSNAYVWERGYGATFTIESGMAFYLNIYISSQVVANTAYTGPDTWAPKLIKTA